MNKLAAVWYTFCIIVLYYIARPIHCTLAAAIDSGLLNKGHFVNSFKFYWEVDYGHEGALWELVKERWYGE